MIYSSGIETDENKLVAKTCFSAEDRQWLIVVL